MTVNLVLVGGVVKDGVEGSKMCIIVLLVLVLVWGRSDGGWRGDGADGTQFVGNLGASWLTNANAGDVDVGMVYNRVPTRIGAGVSDS